MEPQNQGTMACLHVVAFFFFKQNKFFFLHTCFKIRYSAENRKSNIADFIKTAVGAAVLLVRQNKENKEEKTRWRLTIGKQPASLSENLAEMKISSMSHIVRPDSGSY